MRLCLAEVEHMVEWNVQKRQFKEGHVHKTYDLYLRTITGPGNNWTLTLESDNEKCLQTIQDNKTDVIVQTFHFPLNPNLTNIRQGQVQGEYNTVITSMYDSNVTKEDNVDIIDTFNCLDPDIWVLIMAMLLLIGGLMVFSFVVKSSFMMRPTKQRLFLNRACVLRARLIRNRKKHRKRMIVDELGETFNMIWKGMINKDDSLSNPRSRQDQSWSRAILRIALCFFMFLIIFYFTSMVRTELVTVKSPELIHNYEDVLKKENMMPAFIATNTDYLPFKEANDKNSKEAKIWARVLHQPGGVAASMMHGHMFVKGISSMLEQKAVLIHTRERGYIIRTFACKTKAILVYIFQRKDFVTMRSWTEGDPSAISVLRGFVFNVGFHDKTVEKRLLLQFEHGFEKHIHTIVQLDIEKSPKLKETLDDPSPLEEKRECLGDTVEKPLPTINQPSWANFKKLIVYQLGMGLNVAFGTLVLEFAVYFVKKRVKERKLKEDAVAAMRPSHATRPIK